MSDQQIKEALGTDACPNPSLLGSSTQVRGLKIAMKICKQFDGGVLALSSIGKGSSLVFTMLTHVPSQQDIDRINQSGVSEESKPTSNGDKSSILSLSLPSGVQLK